MSAVPTPDRKAVAIRLVAEWRRRGAPVIYEASVLEDGIFVAVDILERRRGGFHLIEVKSTLDVKDEHIADVAVQMHVVCRAGLAVKRAEVMFGGGGCLACGSAGGPASSLLLC